MNIKEIIEKMNMKHPANWVFIIFFLIFCFAVRQSPTMGIAFAVMPTVLVFFILSYQSPIIAYLLLFVINYFVMGVNRYVPVSASIVVDTLFFYLFSLIILKKTKDRIELTKLNNPLTYLCLLWFIFCVLEALNPNTESLLDWYTYVRQMAFYPLFTVIIVVILIKERKYINWILVFWAIFTILAAAKGYWQRNHGFDSTEIKWLFVGEGARTHIISTGIRYFSFFTDAGNFGSSMGFSMVTFSIASMFVKNKIFKVLLVIASIAGGYGMIISGTRGALAVPFAGYLLFIILSKRWKYSLSGFFIILSTFCILNFTTIGDGYKLIHRMRSAFDLNDASLNVRFQNQEIMRNDMKDMPFGAGIGISSKTIPLNSKLRTLAEIPKDSWYVKVWVYTGVVGLTLYILLLIATVIWGSYILMYKVKNNELRGVLVGMMAGTFGMMASAYGNEIFTQFPNCILIYTCLALVFLAPYFDKELERKETEQITQA